MQQQIKGSERIPLVQPHRRLIRQAWFQVIKSSRKLVSGKRLGRGRHSAYQTEIVSLQERAEDRTYLFCLFNDMILQCRKLNERAFEMVRHQDLIENYVVDEGTARLVTDLVETEGRQPVVISRT